MNRAPDYSGIARVWKIAHGEELRAAHLREFGYADSAVSTYIINGPYHPLWSWWFMGVVSLEDVPGAPRAHHQYAEAEYELMILSINPEIEDGVLRAVPDIAAIERGDLGERGYLGYLDPADLVFQFHGVTREQAESLGDTVAQRIAAGQSCDQDYRRWWTNALTDTVGHMIAGAHA